jgi:hypothetical protein
VEPFFRADIFATINMGSHSYRPFRPRFQDQRTPYIR